MSERAKPNADVIALILSEEGVANAPYLAVKIADTFDPAPSRVVAMRSALQQIATGSIVGEPNNARDTLSIVRDIAREALGDCSTPATLEQDKTS